MVSFTPPTREQPLNNELGKFGVAFPVGKVVYILDADDSVKEVEHFTDPTDVDLMKAGSGDFGKALFRRGKTYTITAGEDTILTNAGYNTV
jgi:hypothetical protein